MRKSVDSDNEKITGQLILTGENISRTGSAVLFFTQILHLGGENFTKDSYYETR